MAEEYGVPVSAWPAKFPGAPLLFPPLGIEPDELGCPLWPHYWGIPLIISRRGGEVQSSLVNAHLGNPSRALVRRKTREES